MKNVIDKRHLYPVVNEEASNILLLLKACEKQKDLGRGSKLHAYVREHKFLGKDRYIASSLVSMYARCGALAKAQHLLNEFPARNAVTWTALIQGYIEQGKGDEALQCLDSMEREGHTPDSVTYACALKACGSIGASAQGERIHDKIVSLGMLEEDVVLGGALVDMYVRCDALAKAQKVLDELPARDVVTWNTLIAGYAQQGQGEEALKCIDRMQQEGYSPDMVTFICALKACGSLGASVKGKQIHDKIVSLGILESDIILGNTLVDMYARCGALAKAEQVFSELRVRNVVTWTALISGYAQHGQGEQALECFDRMQYEGHFPNVVTFTCALKACGNIGAAAKGGQIHDAILSLGILEEDVALGNTLVDMYAKCSALEKAVKVFEELPTQDVITWNALIGGYALQGQSVEALNCLEKMQSKGVTPDSTTLICVLNACSHSGLLDRAKMQFTRTCVQYGIASQVEQEHYCCMVDLFCRAGNLNEVFVLIERMPFADYLPAWLALLSACRNWGEVKIGRMAFERALLLDVTIASAYSCMASIYTAAGMQEDAEKIELMAMTNEALKMPGCC